MMINLTVLSFMTLVSAVTFNAFIGLNLGQAAAVLYMVSIISVSAIVFRAWLAHR